MERRPRLDTPWEGSTTSSKTSKDETTAQLTMIYAIMTQPFAEEELGAALASPQPQEALHDLVVNRPVRKIGEFYGIQTRDDVRYVTSHPQVEQGFKYLGSDRPRIFVVGASLAGVRTVQALRRKGSDAEIVL